MSDAIAAGDAAARAALCLDDMAEAARAGLPSDVWDFIEGGSGAELTLEANRTALDALYVVPRVLRDASRASAECLLIGSPVRMPVAVAPMAYQRLAHPEGELGSARAAGAAGVPFTVPMLSSVAVEELAKVGASLWFQLYWLRDRGLTAELLARAEAAGCRAVMLTVDVPRMGKRLRDARSSFVLPRDVRAVHFTREDATAAQQRRHGASAVADHTRKAFDPSLSWADLEWLRSQTRLPLILKGVLDAEDALQAVWAGVDGLVVSNHGGRQLDGALPGIEALPDVREAVGDGCELLLDGGIRSGTDVLKALARGASGVLLGRPVLHGLAVGGKEGAERTLALLHDELDDALVLSGCRGPDDAARLRLTTFRAGNGRDKVRA
ncbi:alpha-hydroxy acid oxidase [Streptomyces diacarni]|uniref:alpha-hydroxy acid oxidase n=1 Tax=Streptomyces diacarni TaxID=2800381 RepID=UPI0033EEE158